MVDAAGWDPEARYAAILERARADPTVVGVVVFGSRGAGAYVDDGSAVDAFVVVAGTSAEAERWATEHGSDVEIWPMTLDEFRAHGLPETPTSWNRPSFLRARIDLDRLDGEIGRIVEQRRRLAPDEAPALAASALGAYINALYRSLRNLEAGRLLEGRLDAAESIGPLLTAAFALEGRVRPFNKWLPFETRRPRLSEGRFGRSSAPPGRAAMARSSTAGSRTWPGFGGSVRDASLCVGLWLTTSHGPAAAG